MIRMRKLLPILLLIALCSPAFAVGKVTSDPNAKAAPAIETPPADLTTDARLAQKVTYEGSKKMVSTILADLSKSTGVTLKAGRNSSDWQVRDRKMNIFAKDVPLSQLMSSIARVMKFKWEISGEKGAYAYRLFMDRRSLLDAEAQRVREEQKAEEERTKRRAEGLAQYYKIGSYTKEELARMKTESPFMYFVANSGLGRGAEKFFMEQPAALEAIASGQRMEVRGSSLSPAGQAGLAAAIRNMTELETKFGGSKRTLPDDLNAKMRGATVQINNNLEMMQNFPGGKMMLAEIRIQYDGGHAEIPFIDPDSSVAKMVGKALIRCQEENIPMSEAMKDMDQQFMADIVKEFKADQGGEPLNEHPDDPALKKKVTLKQESPKLERVEQALADASKLTVVSDSFGSNRYLATGSLPGTEMELKALLDKIGDAYTYNWAKQKSVLEMRDRNWFKKRAAQIPEAWLETWRQEMIKTGTLDIDSMSQIAILTPEQLTANIMSDEALGQVIGFIYGSRELLRTYASLSTDQRAMIFTAQGLNLDSLTRDQRTQAVSALRAAGLSGMLEKPGRLFLVGTRKADGKRFTYSFKLSDGDKSDNVTTPFMTPAYTPPPKPAEPAKPADKKPADAAKPAADGKSAPADPLGDTPAQKADPGQPK